MGAPKYWAFGIIPLKTKQSKAALGKAQARTPSHYMVGLDMLQMYIMSKNHITYSS